MAIDILVVDDEQDIRDLVSGVLEDEGYETRTAANSDEVFDALITRRPALVLLDEAGGGTAERCRHPLRQTEQGAACRMESPDRRALAGVAALNQSAELVITEVDGIGRRERVGLTDDLAEGIPGRAATARIRRLHAGLPTTLVVRDSTAPPGMPAPGGTANRSTTTTEGTT